MKFKCLDSCGGKCCTFEGVGGEAFIYLTKQDRKRLSLFLSKPELHFAKPRAFDSTRFTDQPSVQWTLNNSEKGCQFFKDGKCGVYEARPTQCRTFPYWPEAEERIEDFKAMCPGIGADEYGDAPEIADAKLLEQFKADKELGGSNGRKIFSSNS